MGRIGIIGIGAVGNAVYQTIKDFNEVSVFDIDAWKCVDPEKLYDSDFVFVCVPTPFHRLTGAWINEVHTALFMLEQNKYKGVVIIKSTMMIGSTRKLSKGFPSLKIVYNPEFLTERSAVDDFKNQQAVILGSDNQSAMNDVADLYKDIFKSIPVYSLSSEEAETIKLIHNSILPVKISFLSELLASTNLNIDQFNQSILLASLFGNLTPVTIPGPDGKIGWAGKCFVKDTLALARNMGDFKTTLQGAIDTNKHLRPSAYNGEEDCGLADND
jgi:UDPglucose 6-dehydrogenase